MKTAFLLLALALPPIFASVSVPTSTITYTGTPLVSNEALEFAPLSTSTVALLVRNAEHLYGLGEEFYQTVKYESAGFQNIQSKVLNDLGPNGHEDSWGICQIHLPAHPDVTRAQALNIKWAIDWCARNFKKDPNQWTGYRVLYGAKISPASGAGE